MTVLERLGPLLAEGAAVVFDELFNYPTYELHELKALLEYVNERGCRIEWIGKQGPVDPSPTSDGRVEPGRGAAHPTTLKKWGQILWDPRIHAPTPKDDVTPGMGTGIAQGLIPLVAMALR